MLLNAPRSPLFAASPDDASARDGGVPAASSSNIAQAPALFDGSADDEPLAGPVDGASKPARVLPDQFAHAGEASAARGLLHETQLASFRQLCARHRVDYRWLLDLSVASASRLWRATRACFQDRIRRLHDAQRDGTVQCMRFTWYIMSGETPMASESEHRSRSCRDNRVIHSKSHGHTNSVILCFESGQGFRRGRCITPRGIGGQSLRCTPARSPLLPHYP